MLWQMLPEARRLLETTLLMLGMLLQLLNISRRLACSTTHRASCQASTQRVLRRLCWRCATVAAGTIVGLAAADAGIASALTKPLGCIDGPTSPAEMLTAPQLADPQDRGASAAVCCAAACCAAPTA